MTKPDERQTPRTWNDGWRCAECCNGDRCDDSSHYDRAKCPHCKGTGSAIWNMYAKENEAKALKAERDALREALREMVRVADTQPFCPIGHVIEHGTSNARALLGEAT